MIDFTKEIKLAGKWQKKYLYLRVLIFAVFFSTGIYVSYKILFPSENAQFLFSSPNSLKNDLISPRKQDSTPYQDGGISKEEKMIFNAPILGNFSNSKIGIILEKDYFNKFSGKIEARKSYQAFFYPEGKPMPFKEGSLLRNKSDYYIVSENKLRRFESESVVSEFGYNKKAFIQATDDEIGLNEAGYGISKTTNYPSGSLFRVGEEYFQLHGKELRPFVSDAAYLTSFSPEHAIEKEVSFLRNYEVSGDFLGFADGTLLSNDISVYVVSGKNSYPINNPRTFESMGYRWDEVLPANSEEIGIYEEQKLFTLSSPHPEGTIFKTSDTGRYFYIKDREKRELVGASLISSYLSNLSPVSIEEKGLSTFSSCEIMPDLKLLGRFKCIMEIGKFDQFKGNNLEFKLSVNENAEFKKITSKLQQSIEIGNMKETLSILKKRILDNYTQP